MDAASSGLKKRGTIWLVISTQFKIQRLSEYGGSLMDMAWVTLTSVKAPLKQNETCIYTQVLGEHMLPSRFREGLACFSKTIPNHILHVLQQHGSTVKESRS